MKPEFLCALAEAHAREGRPLHLSSEDDAALDRYVKRKARQAGQRAREYGAEAAFMEALAERLGPGQTVAEVWTPTEVIALMGSLGLNPMTGHMH